jgi:hypothetical protein
MTDFNPYAAPESIESSVLRAVVIDDGQAEPVGVFRLGKQLVMHRTAILPNRCVKSNEPVDQLRLVRSLSWHHPLVYLTLLINILVFIIVALAVRKQATIRVGLSDEWFRKRRMAILIGWTFGLLGIAIVVVSLMNTLGPGGSGYAGLGIVCGLVMLLAAAIFGIVRAQIVRPARITNEYIWLTGVHPDYLAELPEWPYA